MTSNIDESVIIDDAFKKEIGIDVNSAIGILIEEGVSVEDMAEITNKLKDVITYETERKKVPYEYRFLLLNVILCTMFKMSVAFNKRLITAIKEIAKEGQEKENNINLIKEE